MKLGFKGLTKGHVLAPIAHPASVGVNSHVAPAPESVLKPGSEVIFVEIQTILRCPSCTWCCTFLQVVSYQCFTVRTDMGRGHVEVQVELSWAGNSGLNLDLYQTPFHVPSLIYCWYYQFHTRAAVPGVHGINAVVSEPEFKFVNLLPLRLCLIPASLVGEA